MPWPGCEYTSNTCDMRLIAPSPVPGLPPVEKPSRRHFATSSMPGPLSSPMQPDAAALAALQRLRDQLAAAAVLDEVAADFHRDQRRAAGILFVESLARRQRRHRAPRLRDLARFGDDEALHVTSSA